MIGLGAKYLTAAGFGRYRITAASLGNLFYRLSSWLMNATMQAILAAFGDDGKAVIEATNEYLNGIAASDRDKAQQIAYWLNTYAIEDAYVVCSLVPTLGIDRWLMGDGVAYIITPMVYNSDAPNHKWHQNLVLKVTKNIPHSGYADYGIGGEFTSNVVFGWFHYYYNGTEAINFAGSNIGANCVRFPVIGEKYDMYGTIENGTLSTYNTAEGVVRTTSLTPFTTNNPLRLFRNRGMNNSAALEIAKSIYEIDDVTMCYYIPFKTGKAWAAEDVSTGVAQVAGTCGMIDLLTGIFYPNANSSGSFTISETPSTP